MTTEHAYLVFEKAKLDRVTFPDGSVIYMDGGQGAEQLARFRADVAAQRAPHTTTGDTTFDEWRKTQPTYATQAHLEAEWEALGNALPDADDTNIQDDGGSVSPRVGWIGVLAQPEQTAVLTAEPIESWPMGGLPLIEVAAALDRCAADGWDALSVTEDKGLYRGTDAENEAGPVRIRILLQRKSSSVQQ